MVVTKNPIKRNVSQGKHGLFIPEGITEKEYKQMPEPVKKLVTRLSSPRLRSPGTLTSYIESANRFFQIIGPVRQATGDDFRNYFIARRRQNISERTLGKEFYHLKKLAQANGWLWPFEKEDVPTTYEDPYAPVFSLAEVGKLIKAHPLYTTPEKFYLACSTIWGLRSIELTRISKRDYDGQSIAFHKSKRERPMRRLIPEILKPLFLNAHPTIADKSGLSALFQRICKKAELERPERASFHAIRHALTTELEYVMAGPRLPKSYLGEWIGWSKERTGREAAGAAMAGNYIKHGGRTDNAFYLDEVILPIHPFLPFWKGVKP